MCATHNGFINHKKNEKFSKIHVKFIVILKLINIFTLFAAEGRVN